MNLKKPKSIRDLKLEQVSPHIIPYNRNIKTFVMANVLTPKKNN